MEFVLTVQSRDRAGEEVFPPVICFPRKLLCSRRARAAARKGPAELDP